jgi:hypothetical protein
MIPRLVAVFGPFQGDAQTRCQSPTGGPCPRPILRDWSERSVSRRRALITLDGEQRSRYESRPPHEAAAIRRRLNVVALSVMLDKHADDDHRRQLLGQISLDATFIRRAYKDMPAQIDVNGIFTGGVFRGYEDVSQDAILLQTNNVWNTPIYTGVEVVGSQRTRRSQFSSGTHTRVSAPRRDVATERSRVVHPTHGLCQRSRHRLDSGQRKQQPVGHCAGAKPDVDRARAAPCRIVQPAMGGSRSPAICTSSRDRTPDRSSACWQRLTRSSVRRCWCCRMGEPCRIHWRRPCVSRTSLAARGSFRLHPWRKWNARVGRRFALGSRRFEIALNLWNITNRAAARVPGWK